MIRPPPCPQCASESLPTLTLVGPKGIPLDLPNVWAFAGTRETIWGLVEQLRVTLTLHCPDCGHSYEWTKGGDEELAS